MTPMQRALELARQGLGTASPNPSVGAVLVRDGSIVGEGVTQPAGGPHAEAMAIAQAGDKARGAALYVTLEPCNYHGRTPPCVPAIVGAGVAEVHAATLDPNPRVDGRGAADLEAAGVRVSVGEEAAAAQRLMEAHCTWITTGMPFVLAKYAMSLDGKTATAAGDSRWISGAESRRWVHRMRASCDAIMVGIGTALRDDPQLTARDEDNRPLDRQPLRVVVDSHGRLPGEARLLQSPGCTLVAVADASSEREAALRNAGAEVLAFPASTGQVDLRSLLQHLGSREVTGLLVEGGGTLLASLFRQGLVDKVCAFVAPLLIGGRDAPTPWDGAGAGTIADALRLERVSIERLGDDMMVVGYPARRR